MHFGAFNRFALTGAPRAIACSFVVLIPRKCGYRSTAEHSVVQVTLTKSTPVTAPDSAPQEAREPKKTLGAPTGTGVGLPDLLR